MPFKFSYALVGLFVIVLGGAWIGISMWLAYGDFDKDYLPYRVYIRESVSGLYVDAPVKYRGVDVGKVREIVLDPQDPERVRVTMDIEHEVPIKQDTRAVLSIQGLTGIGFIELTGGTRASPRLTAEPGQDYPVMESGPSLFVRMDAAVSELVANLNQFITDARVLMDPELLHLVRETVTNIRTVTQTLAERSDTLNAGLLHAETLLENSARASRKMPELIERINAGAGAVETMAEQIGQAGKSVTATVQQGGDSLVGFGQDTLPDMNRLVRDLRELVAGLERVSRKVEEDPRMLLYGETLSIPGPGE